MITPAQVRGARAMLRISVAELAEAAGVGTTTIKRYEAADELPAASIRTAAALRAALERMGCEFPDPYTVRLRPEALEAQRQRRRR